MRAHWTCLLTLFASAGAASTPTSTTATGRESGGGGRSALARYADTAVLERRGLEAPDGKVVLTDDGVARCAARGRLTSGVVEPGQVAATPPPDAADRARWRERYRRQKERVDALGASRGRVLERIAELERRKPDVRNFARIDRERKRLEGVEARIREEERKLAAIVHEARRHGAQPGWFRGAGP